MERIIFSREVSPAVPRRGIQYKKENLSLKTYRKNTEGINYRDIPSKFLLSKKEFIPSNAFPTSVKHQNVLKNTQFKTDREELQRLKFYKKTDEWKCLHEIEKEFDRRKRNYVEKLLEIKRKRDYLESKGNLEEKTGEIDQKFEIKVFSYKNDENKEKSLNLEESIQEEPFNAKKQSKGIKILTRNEFIKELILKENLKMESKMHYNLFPDYSLPKKFQISSSPNRKIIHQLLEKNLDSITITGRDYNSFLKDEMKIPIQNLKKLSLIKEKYSNFCHVETKKEILELPKIPAKKKVKHRKTKSMNNQANSEVKISLFERIQNEILLKAIPEKSGIYKYYVGRGNNGSIVKYVLGTRPWWREALKSDDDINFLWTQILKPKFLPKIGFSNDFETKNYNPKKACIHNHFPNNFEIGFKKNLYQNLKRICQERNLQMGNFVPFTLHIENDKSEFFHNFTSQGGVWIIKPGELTNRGNGIIVSSNLNEITDYMNKCSNHTFIVQKYIENPLLYNKRKFDFRCYLLISSFAGDIRGYFYNEGYVRTSSEEFSIENFENEIVHLTNDAVQKKGKNYGKFEPCNKVSFADFEKYICQEYKTDFKMEGIVNKMKEIIKTVLESTHFKLDPMKHKQIYELFGLDFMLDSNFNLKLIEINSNPCLETPCSLLQRIISSVLENSFRLTIDIIFPSPEKYTKSAKELSVSKKENFELIFKN